MFRFASNGEKKMWFMRRGVMENTTLITIYYYILVLLFLGSYNQHDAIEINIFHDFNVFFFLIQYTYQYLLKIFLSCAQNNHLQNLKIYEYNNFI